MFGTVHRHSLQTRCEVSVVWALRLPVSTPRTSHIRTGHVPRATMPALAGMRHNRVNLQTIGRHLCGRVVRHPWRLFALCLETAVWQPGDPSHFVGKSIAPCRGSGRTLTGMIRTPAGVHRTLSGKSRTMTGDWSPSSRDRRLLRWRGKDSHRLYKGTPCRRDPATRPQRHRLRSKASVNQDAANWAWIDQPNPAQQAQVP